MTGAAKAIIAVLLIAVGALAFLLWRGQPATEAVGGSNPLDQREALLLNAEQHHHILGEMRSLLTAVALIQQARARDDWTAIAEAASGQGTRRGQTPPAGMRQAQPPAFRQMGRGMREQFDVIADAAAAQNGEAVDTALTAALGACMGCHESYRVQLAR
ncbi:MAG: cytochrome c [Sphingomonadaceae bacterium]|nr:cytochrome c [Sphingomonadaceae bacterium]